MFNVNMLYLHPLVYKFHYFIEFSWHGASKDYYYLVNDLGLFYCVCSFKTVHPDVLFL